MTGFNLKKRRHLKALILIGIIAALLVAGMAAKIQRNKAEECEYGKIQKINIETEESYDQEETKTQKGSETYEEISED